MPNILWFKDITTTNVSEVGGKNASLGEMYNHLKGVPIPNGFAITTSAYQSFLSENKLDQQIKGLIAGLDVSNLIDLQDRSQKIRNLIRSSSLPASLIKDIGRAYRKLSSEFTSHAVDVAVRSSGIAEDLPEASFAGQQATFLNVVGEESLLEATRNCFASLFTDRAISYREGKGFDLTQISISVGIQKMIRSDKASSGVVFTIHPETGFPGVFVVNSSWGLGEPIVQGEITPDEFQVFKEGLKKGFPSIIVRELGSKEKTLIYDEGFATKLIATQIEKRRVFSLRDDEVLRLSNWALQIEGHYKKPMDIEWAKDSLSEELYIVQARPETVHSVRKKSNIERFTMKKPSSLIVKGSAVGTKIIEGKARVINDVSQVKNFQEGEVLVTKMTEPDWEPLLKIASAIVTDEGGRISHAGILAQELGIPAVVGCAEATEKISTGEVITVDCSQGSDGFVWKGKTLWEVKTYSVEKLAKTKTKIMLSISNPFEAYESFFLPNEGVGIAKEEFIIASKIRIHPLALVNFDSLEEPELKNQIEKLTHNFQTKSDYYIQELASGIAQIATAFYPKEVAIRFCNFNSNEYANLIGGSKFEPKEANPILGWRGTSRFSDPRFFDAFGLECRAVKIAREVWGLRNIALIIPFCKTVTSAEKTLEVLAQFGLQKGVDGLRVYLSTELLSNVEEAKAFCKLFDGFLLDLDSLVQLSFGSEKENLSSTNDGERSNEKLEALIVKLLKIAKEDKKSVRLFGERYINQKTFLRRITELGVEAISTNPDDLVKTTLAVLDIESSRNSQVKD